jgi:cytochrome d ubiquinol oxidase subunit I
MTGKTVWRDMVKFWGTLFGINFAMGVATGITMEFQFGTNWAYYSHYVGDIFGVPLAIEGLMAFFLEATFVGLFFFGWNKLSRLQHLVVTWLLAIGANFSALWILIANGWMQNPVGSRFNFETMRMELHSMYEVFFNEVAQAKFVHTVSAGYVTGSMFVLSISALYMLRGKHTEIAKRSLAVAASFGLASALSVVVLGDESGYTTSHNQKAKLAAMEAMWKTEPAPAHFTLLGIPDEETQTTKYEVKIPYMLGLIATRSLTEEVPGIREIVAENEQHIKEGIIAYQALGRLRADKNDLEAKALFEQHSDNLGYGLLLKRQRDDIENATPEQIAAAAKGTIPPITPLFWSFRFMVAIGLFQIVLFAAAFRVFNWKQRYPRWLLRVAVLSLPLPWIASELGWIVAEVGRQPWAIDGVLPTFLGVSSVSPAHVWASFAAFVVFYSALLIVDITLMIKYVKLGPVAGAAEPKMRTVPAE